MLEKLPRAVRRARWFDASEFAREVRDSRSEIGVGLAAFQKVQEVFAKRAGVFLFRGPSIASLFFRFNSF